MLPGVLAVVGAAVGAALPPYTVAGDASRNLATFLGLFAASILPSVTLLLNSLTSSGRSVAKVNALSKELGASVDALFEILGLVVVAVLLLLLLAVPSPAPLHMKLGSLSLPAAELLNRGGQALTIAAVALLMGRVGFIPNSIRRSLAIRAEIAAEEAKRKTLENAGKADPASYFKTKPGFGAVRSAEAQEERPQ